MNKTTDDVRSGLAKLPEFKDAVSGGEYNPT
jgi:hypothetical protein